MLTEAIVGAVASSSSPLFSRKKTLDKKAKHNSWILPDNMPFAGSGLQGAPASLGVGTDMMNSMQDVLTALANKNPQVHLAHQN